MPRKAAVVSEDEMVVERKVELGPPPEEPPTESLVERSAQVFLSYLTPDVVETLEKISVLNKVSIAQLIISCVVRAHQQGALTETIASDAAKALPFERAASSPTSVKCAGCGKLIEVKVYGQTMCSPCVLAAHEAEVKENYRRQMGGINRKLAGSGEPVHPYAAKVHG
jgi:hypothetical protein